MNELPKVQTKTNTERSILFLNSLTEINKYLMIISAFSYNLLDFPITTPCRYTLEQKNYYEILVKFLLIRSFAL